ncbi:torsin-like protein [Episyrphus balteatus]|uniref:torsin-like protein n=1 Tax=Episyrphus balteatus TaxID=286459 RepID=UPI0024868E30|nr:torsin-like protein [Episyrphus balteatus]
MKTHTIILFIVIISLVTNYSHAVDPITFTVGTAVLAGFGYNFDYVKQKTYCSFQECCSDYWIPGDINKLKNELESHLFGQHIVLEKVIPAIRAHFSKDTASKKALVLSFHGTPGTGKNYVADFIAKSLYLKGLESKFVHLFKGRADFPYQSESERYSKEIKELVEKSVTDCPRSLFIFDEVDKMPHGIFESLTSLVDYYSTSRGPDYRQAIFVFVSNTAGLNIALHLGSLLKQGTLRESTRMSDFEKILELGAYNLEGGMKKTGLIEAHVVDHYIPFLPLEKEHVYKCIEAEFQRWDKTPDRNVIENMINEYVSFEKKTGIFATSGCKKLDKKVAVEAESMF